MIGDHPVLVAFEQSVLDQDKVLRSHGRSPIPRRKAREAFRWVSNLCSPTNRVAERHATALRERLRAQPGRAVILVVGGGTIGSGALGLYDDDLVDIVGFDIYASPHTQFIADAHAIPLADGSVHAVWVQAVLEHVLDPFHVVEEIERVLIPNGLVYAETPFLQQVHEGAYDFMRFTESGHRWLFRRFERLNSGVVAGPGTQLAWTMDHATRALFRSKLAGRAVRLFSFWTRVIDRVASPPFAIDDASCVFFFGRKTGVELTPREIIDHYQGAQRSKASR